MADIVRPVFGGRKSEAQIPQTDQVASGFVFSEDEIKRFEDDIKFYVSHLDLIREARGCGDAMTSYIFDELPGFVKKNQSLDLRQGVVEQLLLETLCTHLTTSDKKDWAEKHHFYGAVFVEFDSRCSLLQEAWDQLKNETSTED